MSTDNPMEVPMELKEIKQLIRLVDQKEFAEFELVLGEFKLRIKRNETPIIQVTGGPEDSNQGPSVTLTTGAMEAGSNASAVPEIGPMLEAEPDEAIPRANVHLITSPIVGTFYRAPNPTSEPFVREGDQVQPGSTLCIVEAMKLMNEIPCDVAGEVVRIHVDDGQPVEYGQPLFSIRMEASGVADEQRAVS